jgi:broad specificity phosphatase PhoE
MDQLSGTEGLRNSYWVMRHGQSKANVGGVIVSSIDADRRGDFGLSEAGREQVLAAARGSGLTAGTLICSSDFARARQTAQLMRDCLGTAEVVSAPALRERYFGDFDGGPVTGYAQVWTADEAGARAAANPLTASPATDNPGADSPLAGAPATDSPATGGPATTSPATDNPLASGPATGGPATDSPAADNPLAASPGAGDPGAGDPGAGGSAGRGVETAAAVLDRVAGLVAGLERGYSGRDILLVSHGDTLQILQAGFAGIDPSRHRTVPHLEVAEIRLLQRVQP